MSTGQITTRRAQADDRAAILGLCRRALGWRPDDPDEAFFKWKHDDNAFGASPSWIAESDDGRVVGLRVLLRWRFVTSGGGVLSAVRAVDTATDPEFEGRGIFTRLTLDALPDLRDDGVDLVFNTPNDKSRPGYLKMGWGVVGRVPVVARVTSANSFGRLATARTAAELWSESVDCGLAADDVFADPSRGAEVTALLESLGRPSGLTTDRDLDFLRWRYGFEPLRYRVFPIGDSIGDGIVVFRVRRRGQAFEAAVCDVIAPPGTAAGPALRQIGRTSGADYLLATSRTVDSRAGFVPAPRLGPILTWRPVRRPGVPAMSSLHLTLGDLELF